MKKLNNKGFTAVEGLLIFVVIAIIGGAGWYVWHSRQEADKSLNNAASQNYADPDKVTNFDECKKLKSSKIQESYPAVCVTSSGKKFTDTSDQTVNWTQWKAPDSTFNMRIPDGWNMVQNGPNSPYLQITDNKLEITPGTKGKYEVSPGYGKDYDSGLFLYTMNEPADFDLNVKSYTKQTSLKTKNGLEIKKYTFTQKEDSQGIGLKKGGKAYSYGIFAGKNVIYCNYSVQADQTDYHTNVEAALSTVTIP